MPNIMEGQLDAKGLKFAIIVARFNSIVTERLLEGALDAIRRCGGDADSTQVYRVPGSWEMPVVAAEIAGKKKVDGIICLGAVVRGDTPHFDYVCAAAQQGLTRVSLDEKIPVAFGVLTTDSLQQAMDRAGGKSGNKGFDAAMTAIEMAQLLRNVRRQAE